MVIFEKTNNSIKTSGMKKSIIQAGVDPQVKKTFEEIAKSMIPVPVSSMALAGSIISEWVSKNKHLISKPVKEG